MSVVVTALTQSDRHKWESLWQESVDGVMSPEVIEHSFNQIMGGTIRSYVAYVDEVMVGLMHCIIHPVAGCIYPVCYMQDLYVSPEYRRQGVARTLLGYLKAQAEAEELDRIYWLLDQTNSDAKEFYKTNGVALDFGLYMIPIKMRDRLNLPQI